MDSTNSKTVGNALKTIQTLMEANMGLAKAVRLVAASTGLPERFLYQLMEYRQRDKEAAQ